MWEVGVQQENEVKPTVISVSADAIDASSLPGYVMLQKAGVPVCVIKASVYLYAFKVS